MSSKNCAEIVESLRSTFNSGKTKNVGFRRRQLQALRQMYIENKNEMLEVLAKDLNKNKTESLTMEVDYLINDIENTLFNLSDWCKPERPAKGFVNLLDSLYIFNDPYGVVLVIGAWNYPMQLTLLPVAGAIAAGNCVVIKPSEVSKNCADFMGRMIPKYLDSECYQVYLGGVMETTTLLKQHFDYIFFTGSTNVGRIVHQAAAQQLTPTTLELGGKSPVFLDSSADFGIATRRLLWGKLVNAGQTCIAPDYLLCTKEVKDKFVKCASDVIKEFFGPDPKASSDYGRIVTERQCDRLRQLLVKTNGKIEIGGTVDVPERYVAPTIVGDVLPNDSLMQEEIFGPILPIVTVTDPLSAIRFINAREKPLSLYIFSTRHRDIQLFLENTSSGGVLVNDTIMHLATEMPFGGVGASGMGNYHSKYSFDTFTHKKSCLYKDFGFIGETLGGNRYPPYSSKKLAILKILLKSRPGFTTVTKYFKYFTIFGIGYFAAVFLSPLVRKYYTEN